MAKHPRKKQKTDVAEVRPLGSTPILHNDAPKDEEERRLESILFGIPFKPSREPPIYALPSGGEMVDDVLEPGHAMEQLQDTDLFFVDGGFPATRTEITGIDVEEYIAGDGNGNEDSADDDALERGGDNGSKYFDGETEHGASTKTIHPPAPPTSSLTKSRKKSAWADPDDATLQISLEANKRLRKLRDAPTEATVGGTQYEAKLRREYERINPAPLWAANARKKLRPKRRRSGLEDCGEDGGENAGESWDEDINHLLTSTSGLLVEERSKLLPKGVLMIERLRDANQSARAEGEIKSVAFHPSTKVPLLLTASADRRLRLFNVDGHTNPHLQTIHIPALPMTNAQFHPSGSSILLTGPRPFYYTYDLQSGATLQSPRGLWATTFASANPAHTGDLSMELCAFDPSGEVLAVAGRRGYVHLVDWKSGAAQVVGSVKMNAPVKALCWARGELMTLAEDAEVYAWNVGERRCLRRWRDDGGFGSVTMDSDHSGRYLGIGSKTGIVNVYDVGSTDSTLPAPPTPLKALGNLTTSISTLRYSRDSQLLAIASKTKKDQMRLIHLSSLTAFSNWPTSSTPLGHVTAIDFSAGTEYVALGNNRGRVLLYSLPHFSVH